MDYLKVLNLYQMLIYILIESIVTQRSQRYTKNMHIPLSGSKWVSKSDNQRVTLRFTVDNRVGTEWPRSQSVDDIYEAAQPWINVTNLHFRYIGKLQSDKTVHFMILKNNVCSPEMTGFNLSIVNKYIESTKVVESSLVTVTIDCQSNFDPKLLIKKLTHIWGRVLGLNSSADPTSIMYPLDSRSPSTNKRDILAAQILYEPNPDFEGDMMSVPFKTDRLNRTIDLCLDSKIDSALVLSDKKWLFFKDWHYFEIGSPGLALTSPRKIKWDFPDFNTTVDASLSWKGDIYLFNDKHYWKYRMNRLIHKQTISRGFPGVPDGPFDDVFQWNFNQKIYFFKRGQFWKYDGKKGSVAKGFPKRMADHWKGVPDSFDAALSSRFTNQTYFFKGNVYYKFDDIDKQVVKDSVPSYPRQTKILITKCRDTLYNIKNFSLQLSTNDFFSTKISTDITKCSCSSGGEIFILIISILAALISFIMFFVWPTLIYDDQLSEEGQPNQQDQQQTRETQMTDTQLGEDTRSDISSDDQQVKDITKEVKEPKQDNQPKVK